MSNIQQHYEVKFKKYAPLVYARAYLRCGEFYEAQTVTEGSFVRSIEIAQMRGDLIFGSREGLKFADYVLSKQPKDKEEGEASGPYGESSFSSSPKLKAMNEMGELLKGFVEKRQMALFLLHVEELDEEKILKLLDLSSEDLVAIKAELFERLQGIEIELTVDDNKLEFFSRTLRQYRLSALFYTTVANSIKASKRVTGAGCFVPLGYFFVTIVSLIYLTIFFDDIDRFNWRENDWIKMMAFDNLEWLLICFMLTKGLHSFFTKHAKSDALVAKSKRLVNALAFNYKVAIPLLVMNAGIYFNLRNFFREDGFLAFLMVLQKLFFLMSVITILLSLNKIALHLYTKFIEATR
jgi:hypothetical protein